MANATSVPSDVTSTLLLTTTVNADTASTARATLEPPLLAAYICFGIGGLLVIIAVIFVVVLSLRHKLCAHCCCCPCRQEEEEDLILQLKYFKAPQKLPPKQTTRGKPPDFVPVGPVVGTGTKTLKYDVAHPTWTVEKSGTGKRGEKDIRLKTTHVPLRSDRVYLHTQNRQQLGRPLQRLQGPHGPIMIGYGRPGEGLKYYRVRRPSDGKNKHLKNWIIKQRDYSSDVAPSRTTNNSNSVSYIPNGTRNVRPASWDEGKQWRALQAGSSLSPSERALYLRWSPSTQRRPTTNTSQLTRSTATPTTGVLGEARAMGGQSQLGIHQLSKETWSSSYTQHLTLPQIQGSATIYRAPLGPKIMVNGTAVNASPT